MISHTDSSATKSRTIFSSVSLLLEQWHQQTYSLCDTMENKGKLSKHDGHTDPDSMEPPESVPGPRTVTSKTFMKGFCVCVRGVGVGGQMRSCFHSASSLLSPGESPPSGVISPLLRSNRQLHQSPNSTPSTWVSSLLSCSQTHYSTPHINPWLHGNVSSAGWCMEAIETKQNYSFYSILRCILYAKDL